ncbi:MAG TPA: hypothetical protein VGB08_02460 [Allosphingosinicella sp.]
MAAGHIERGAQCSATKVNDMRIFETTAATIVAFLSQVLVVATVLA